MSRNNNYQQVEEITSEISPSTKDLLRTQQNNIVCNDCGGISATKVQHLLSTLEGTTQLFNSTSSTNIINENATKSNSIYRKNNNQSNSVDKKINFNRKNIQRASSRRSTNKNKVSNKRMQHSSKQRKLNMNGIRSSMSTQYKNNKIRSKSKNNSTNKTKKLSSKN